MCLTTLSLQLCSPWPRGDVPLVGATGAKLVGTQGPARCPHARQPGPQRHPHGHGWVFCKRPLLVYRKAT